MATKQERKAEFDKLIKDINGLTKECDAMRLPGTEGSPLSADELRNFKQKADELLHLKRQRDFLRSEIEDLERQEDEERSSREREKQDETRNRGGGGGGGGGGEVRRGNQPGRHAQGSQREDEVRNIFQMSPHRMTADEKRRKAEMSQDIALMYANAGEAGVLKFAAKYDEVRSAIDAGLIRTRVEMTMDHDELRGADDEQGRDELRNLMTSPAANGGVLIPVNPLGELVTAKRAYYGPIEAGCTVIYTGNGQDMDYPVLDDTGRRATVRMETQALANTTISFAMRKLKAFKYGTGGLLWSKEFARDANMSESLFNQLVLQPLTDSFTRAAAIDMTVGDGISEPEGLLTAIDAIGANAYVAAAANNAITADDLFNLKQGVDIAYRDASIYMASDVDRGRLGLLKDGSGKFYFLRNDGQRDVMDAHGFRLQVMTSLPATAYGSNQTRILFGDPRYYLARIVQGVQFFRSEHVAAANNQWAIYGFGEMGGRYVNPANNAQTQPIKGLRMP